MNFIPYIVMLIPNLSPLVTIYSTTLMKCHKLKGCGSRFIHSSLEMAAISLLTNEKAAIQSQWRHLYLGGLGPSLVMPWFSYKSKTQQKKKVIRPNY